MKEMDAQNFDIDISGTLEWAIPYQLPGGMHLYEMRISKWNGNGTEYTIVGDVRYFGFLDEDSIKPQTKIRFLQTMLPSGSIHQIVFTKNYVASGNPVSKEEIEGTYSQAYGDLMVQRLGKIQKSH
jgi:hypothetical protein